MQLTEDVLARFVGGQIEIQNQGEGYLFRGEIETITVDGNPRDGDLVVRLRWMAKAEGYPPLPERWVNEENLDYRASLIIYTADMIEMDRIMLQCLITGEMVVIFPPNGSKLDPSKVEGLQLV